MENAITVRVKVQRGLTPQEVLNRSGLVLYVESGLESMPVVDGAGEEEVTLVFFKTKASCHYHNISNELEKHGLSQDIAAQVQYNSENPEFAFTHPNCNGWDSFPGASSPYGITFLGSKVEIMQKWDYGSSWDNVYYYVPEGYYLCGRKP